MKKKTLSLALALAMCLSLTAPAFAEDRPIPSEEGVKNISITADIGELSLDDLNVEKSWTMVSYDFDEETGDVLEVREEVEAYEAIKRDTKFTVKHTGTVDDGTTIEIYVTPYVKLDDGAFDWMDWPHSNYLTHEGGFVTDMMDPEGYGGLVELKAGESVSFTLPFNWFDGEDGSQGDGIFMLRAIMYYPQYDWSFWKYAYFKVDEAAYNAAVAKGPSAQPEQPTDPEPTTPPAETIPASGTAKASTQTVTVDGKAVEFQMYALVDENGNGTNYIKLRDMAQVLNGTKAQFSVGYDNASKSISVATGEAYTSTGSEMTTPFSGDRAYTGGSQSIQVDGEATEMTAITLLDDAGGGYNYFKLRDLGKALGFNVGWSKEAGVFIESDKPYAE